MFSELFYTIYSTYFKILPLKSIVNDLTITILLVNLSNQTGVFHKIILLQSVVFGPFGFVGSVCSIILLLKMNQN